MASNRGSGGCQLKTCYRKLPSVTPTERVSSHLHRELYNLGCTAISAPGLPHLRFTHYCDVDPRSLNAFGEAHPIDLQSSKSHFPERYDAPLR
jgi:hypothetical protein